MLKLNKIWGREIWNIDVLLKWTMLTGFHESESFSAKWKLMLSQKCIEFSWFCLCVSVCVRECVYVCVCVFSLVFSLKRANRAKICNFDCVISTNFTFWVFSVLTNFWPMFSHFILNKKTFVKICLLFQEEIYAPPQWVSYLLCVIYTKYTFEVVWNLDWFFVKVNLEPKTDQ